MQLTFSETNKEEKKGCTNDLQHKVNIFLSKSLIKRILKLGWNCIILHDVQIGCQQPTVLMKSEFWFNLKGWTCCLQTIILIGLLSCY